MHRGLQAALPAATPERLNEVGTGVSGEESHRMGKLGFRTDARKPEEHVGFRRGLMVETRKLELPTFLSHGFLSATLQGARYFPGGDPAQVGDPPPLLIERDLVRGAGHLPPSPAKALRALDWEALQLQVKFLLRGPFLVGTLVWRSETRTHLGKDRDVA